ncbi:hypothetical protein [Compostibacter hankyongensis]|uniref:Uncharacterized protein n=1 Tax=Compostibacter hankyongensis TaxID=1007089 RepID=A0ABP8GAL7_9BACT
MTGDESQKKLQDIVRGAFLEGEGDHCTTVRNLLCQSFGSDTTVKSEFESKAILKEKQAGFLKAYADKTGHWLPSLPSGSQYLTRGGEAEVYLAKDRRHVIKVNDGIYYATWLEYFNSLVIHNLLFPNTAYSLLGFTENNNKNLCVVLEQSFVEGEQAELNAIKQLLVFNGFVNVKHQDYYNEALGLLLEDMHDENVIAKDDVRSSPPNDKKR